jgi:YHS domain-containing protein
MKTRSMILAAASWIAAAQATQPSPQLVSACVQSQQQAASLAARVNQRLEAARQTNEAAAMRAAMDDLQAALVELRAALQACDPLQVAADPHAGHAMPGTTPAPAPAAPKAPTPVDPHAGHATPAKPAAPPAAKPGAPVAKPTPKPADPHAGHATPVPAKPAAPSAKPGAPAPKETIDPVCAKKVDPETAPSTTYKGKVYYFCSPADRLKFIRNPETWLKKGPGGP